MRIVRPVDGFNVTERPAVQASLDAASPSCTWLEFAYANLLARLRMAAHKMGEQVGDNPSYRVYVEVDPKTNQNRLGVTYFVLGDRLTILGLKRSEEHTSELQSH